MPVFHGNLAVAPQPVSAAVALERSRSQTRSPSPLGLHRYSNPLSSPMSQSTGASTSRDSSSTLDTPGPNTPVVDADTLSAPFALQDDLAGLYVAESYTAPVWIPDDRTDKCMRCSEAFNLWRRRHQYVYRSIPGAPLNLSHSCRLCGLVICASCSDQAFVIPGLEEKARSCTTCFNSVFRPGPPFQDLGIGLTASASLPKPPRSSVASA